MTIYSFWLFDRHCNCIYTKEWHNSRNSTDPSATSISTYGFNNELIRPKPVAPHNKGDDAKLIFGVVYSLRNMVRQLTDEDSFVSFKTTKYRLHFFETASNLRLALLTDPAMDNMRPVLAQIYASLYVEYVVKNPLCKSNGENVNNELFVLGLDAFITSLPRFD